MSIDSTDSYQDQDSERIAATAQPVTAWLLPDLELFSYSIPERGEGIRAFGSYSEVQLLQSVMMHLEDMDSIPTGTAEDELLRDLITSAADIAAGDGVEARLRLTGTHSLDISPTMALDQTTVLAQRFEDFMRDQSDLLPAGLHERWSEEFKAYPQDVFVTLVLALPAPEPLS